MADAASKRKALGRVLLALALAWLLVIVAAAVTGGWRLPGFTLSSSRPLRFALMLLFAGWFVLPQGERAGLAGRFTARQWLGGALSLAVAWHLAYRITRWLSFVSGAYDLSLFESTLHYTLQGNFMFAWGLNRSLFSEHLEPIVLLHLPLWLPFKHPMVLLLTQALAVPLAVVPLYRAARALGLDAALAALAGAAYLLNSVVWQANIHDFHPELFGPLAVFWALDASVRRKWLSLYAACAFAFLIKEEMALVMFCFALLVTKGPGDGRWKHALGVAVFSAAWAVVAFKLIMPASHPSEAPMHPLSHRWAHLGGTYPEMAWGLVSRPGYLLGILFSRPFGWVMASVGFLPLLDPLSFIAALPPLLVHLTSSYGYAARLGAYYGLFGVTLMLVGAVFALHRVQGRFGRNAAVLAGIVALLPIPTVGFLSPPDAADFQASAFIAQIPEEETVCAQSPIATRRTPDVRTLSMVPHCENPTWVLFGRSKDWWPIETEGEYQAYVSSTADAGYEVKFSQGDFLFLKRRQ